jgi:hypothetical protein
MVGRVWARAKNGHWTARIVALASVAVVLAAAAATVSTVPAGASSGAAGAGAARATASPGTGFWYGTDSSQMNVPGPAPYHEPVIGHYYGGYIGMANNWAVMTGCHKIVVFSSTNSSQANNNFTWHHKGIGTGVYFFMGGPGVDPNYNGTTTEASAWGARQAANALGHIANLHVKYPVVFMDIELPGNAPNYTPAPDNGWNSVYTSPCSGKVKINSVPTAVDRADVNGFATYLTSHSAYKAGVYSAPSIWTQIFGTGADASLSNTYEWTYEPFTSSLAHPPSGWCLSGTSTCAQFFGGQTSASKYAVMWQWSGGGGSFNGLGDFDQIDAARTP